jgi:nitroreductase
MSETWDFEVRLRQALAPVDPPADLEERLQTTLGSLVELAAEELETWELSAIKDPRNWPRAALGPAAAVIIGTGAAAGLVVLRTRKRSPKRRILSHGPLDLAERTLRDAGREALRVFRDVAR